MAKKVHATIMFGLFGSSPPPVVESDRVIPLHFFDDAPLWRAFTLYSLFVFDDILDADKLRSSLERLVHKEGWEKLGARLRYNVSTPPCKITNVTYRQSQD
jgi:hypothetical protein